MSAEIIQFVPRPRHDRGMDHTPSSSWSPLRVDELAMAHADTAPCESVPPLEVGYDDDTPA
jgi:hypothetical protein